MLVCGGGPPAEPPPPPIPIRTHATTDTGHRTPDTGHNDFVKTLTVKATFDRNEWASSICLRFLVLDVFELLVVLHEVHRIGEVQEVGCVHAHADIIGLLRRRCRWRGSLLAHKAMLGAKKIRKTLEA